VGLGAPQEQPPRRDAEQRILVVGREPLALGDLDRLVEEVAGQQQPSSPSFTKTARCPGVCPGAWTSRTPGTTSWFVPAVRKTPSDSSRCAGRIAT
jgi:hypothetical protein